MSNIIKRRHTNQYAQIHNNPLQNDLVDLRAIGLLSHLMSLPSDWVIYKTQLYKKFSRKNIDAAWKELANKNYIIGFNCYIDGKKKSFYNVSDIPFVSEELSEFIFETCSELINSGASVKSLNLMSGGTLVITEKSTAVLMVHIQKKNIQKKEKQILMMKIYRIFYFQVKIAFKIQKLIILNMPLLQIKFVYQINKFQ
ncbi:hypothetical protein [Bacillus toyonensis]|uniref:hypothetical protein n=1 Tax=Bacillus toyonensis TaxID=155322 RepID=UPI001F0AB3DC|nr:hypothetical protein [Bacillus toyonensis]